MVVFRQFEFFPHEARLVSRAQVDVIGTEALDESCVDMGYCLVKDAQCSVLLFEALYRDRGLAGVDALMALAAKADSVVWQIASALVPRNHMMTMLDFVLAPRHAAFASLASIDVVLDAVEALHLAVLVINTVDPPVIEFHECELVDLEKPVGHGHEFPHLVGHVQVRLDEMASGGCEPPVRTLSVGEAYLGIDDILDRDNLLAACKLATSRLGDLVVFLSELVRAALAAEPLAAPGRAPMLPALGHQLGDVLVSDLDFGEELDLTVGHVYESLSNVGPPRIGHPCVFVHHRVLDLAFQAHDQWAAAHDPGLSAVEQALDMMAPPRRLER